MSRKLGLHLGKTDLENFFQNYGEARMLVDEILRTKETAFKRVEGVVVQNSPKNYPQIRARQLSAMEKYSSRIGR